MWYASWSIGWWYRVRCARTLHHIYAIYYSWYSENNDRLVYTHILVPIKIRSGLKGKLTQRRISPIGSYAYICLCVCVCMCKYIYDRASIFNRRVLLRNISYRLVDIVLMRFIFLATVFDADSCCIAFYNLTAICNTRNACFRNIARNKHSARLCVVCVNVCMYMRVYNALYIFFIVSCTINMHVLTRVHRYQTCTYCIHIASKIGQIN